MVRLRKPIQLLSALAVNANIGGLVSGRIYQGQLKRLCVPGLNCYSCPAAIGSCPLGSIQFAAASFALPALAYVAGLTILFGALLGRMVCGFLCPFGLFQELINAPLRKSYPLRLKNINYILLAGAVVLPVAAYAETGLGTPVFCKYICPAGTLAGLPLLALNPPLREAVGLLFGWKALVFVCFAVASAAVYRPFCRICPLGAFYGLFNRVAVVGMDIERDRCTGCGICADICPVNTSCDARECVRCGRCAAGCPENAVRYRLRTRKRHI